MKRIISILLMIIVTFGNMGLSFAEGEDVPSSWALEEINELKEMKSIVDLNEPVVDESFFSRYHDNITRDEFVHLAIDLWEQYKGTEFRTYVTEEDNPFTDVSLKDGQHHIVRAYKRGIIEGYGNGLFGPNDLITREQICVLLNRVVKATGVSLDYEKAKSLKFADHDEISGWALADVQASFQHGIMQGVGNNRINPKGYLTREQALLLIKRLIKSDVNPKKVDEIPEGWQAVPETDVYAPSNEWLEDNGYEIYIRISHPDRTDENNKYLPIISMSIDMTVDSYEKDKELVRQILANWFPKDLLDKVFKEVEGKLVYETVEIFNGEHRTYPLFKGFEYGNGKYSGNKLYGIKGEPWHMEVTLDSHGGDYGISVTNWDIETILKEFPWIECYEIIEK